MVNLFIAMMVMFVAIVVGLVYLACKGITYLVNKLEDNDVYKML